MDAYPVRDGRHIVQLGQEEALSIAQRHEWLMSMTPQLFVVCSVPRGSVERGQHRLGQPIGVSKSMYVEMRVHHVEFAFSGGSNGSFDVLVLFRPTTSPGNLRTEVGPL